MGQPPRLIPARARRAISLAATVLSALATLVDPFGLDVWGYVVRLATNPTIGSRVSEWRPPGLTDAPGILFWLSVVAAALAVGLLWRQRRTFPLPALLTLLAFAALGAITGRGLAWWPFAAVFVLSGFIPAGNPARSTALENRPSALNGFVMGLLVVAGVALLPFWRPTGPAGVPLGTLSYAPQGIASHLDDVVSAQASGLLPRVAIQPRVWAPQHWGSWLELQVPLALYAVDSRIEILPSSIWAENDAVERGDTAPLEARSVGFVVTESGANSALEAALTARGWGPVYVDTDGSIWARLGA